jgi:hypothetical protein
MKEFSIPDGWECIDERGDGAAYRSPDGKLFVIVSIGKEMDNKLWFHLSVSHKKRIPNYDELCFVKEKFLGPDVYAIMVWPPKKNHVNLHPYCLHLWSCLEGHPLPEFSRGLGTI